MPPVHKSPNFAPLRTLSIFPAPMFWDTKVVMAMENAVTGRKINPSVFRLAPMPAMASRPKLLI